jgi:hypothetical protein
MPVARFQGFTVKTKVVVFWVLAPCNDMVGYLHFGKPFYLEAHHTTSLNGVRIQKTKTCLVLLI